MFVGRSERHSATRSARNHPLGDQERLVHIFNCLRLLADTDCQGGQADRPAGELATERCEERPIDFVEAAVVDAEKLPSSLGHVGG